MRPVFRCRDGETMATVIIPTVTDGRQRYSLRTSLGGKTFGFEFIWNVRDLSWSFAMSDASGDVILARKVVLTTPMLSRNQDARLPFGEMIATDTSNQDLEATLTDLGTRVLLCFTDGADIVGTA